MSEFTTNGAFVCNLPDWFDELGSTTTLGDKIFVIHPYHAPHEYNRETKEWEAIEIWNSDDFVASQLFGNHIYFKESE